jgi:RNA polymerase sigma-70 factor (ECF subfamily)
MDQGVLYNKSQKILSGFTQYIVRLFSFGCTKSLLDIDYRHGFSYNSTSVMRGFRQTSDLQMRERSVGVSSLTVFMLTYFLSMLETEEERLTFAAFYEEHRNRCLRAALAITKSMDLAEDAVQDAFLRMIRHKDKYFTDFGKRTGTTIVIMVKSAALNILHRENQLVHSQLDESTPDCTPDVFRIVAGKDAVDRVQHHVSKLDEANQTVYEMKFLRGMSDGEIAEEIGITKNAVAIRIHKIRSSIISTMEAEGFDNVD